MTKKSLARQERDGTLLKKNAEVKQLRKNSSVNSWDQLNAVYSDLKNSFEQYRKIAHAMMNENIVRHMSDVGRMSLLAKGLAADMNHLIAQMNAIYAKHAGKTGIVPQDGDENEWFAILQLMQEYAGVSEQQVLRMAPAAQEVIEEINKAADKARQAAKAAQEQELQDKSVVSDVEVTEVKQTEAINHDSTN